MINYLKFNHAIFFNIILKLLHTLILSYKTAPYDENIFLEEKKNIILSFLLSM